MEPVAMGGPTGNENRATFTFLGFTHYLAKTRKRAGQHRAEAEVKARERFIRLGEDWLKANKHPDVGRSRPT